MTLKLSNIKKLVSSNDVNLNGVPTAPTAAKGTNTTQIATTEFVQTAISKIIPFIKANGVSSNLTLVSGILPFIKAEGNVSNLSL